MDFFKETTKISNIEKYLRNKVKSKTTANKSTNSNESYNFDKFEIDTTLVKQLILDTGEPSFSFYIKLKENTIEDETYNLLIRKIDSSWVTSVFLFVRNNDITVPKKFASINEVYTENGMIDNLFSKYQVDFVETADYHCVGCNGPCDLCEMCVTYTYGYDVTLLTQSDPDDSSGSVGEYNGGSGGSSTNNDQNNCPDGKIKNPTTEECECPDGKVEDTNGNCIDNPCENGKVYNTSTQNCECPKGYTEDANGNCIQSNPCNEIDTQINNTDFKQKIDELKILTGKKQETGYVQNKDGAFTKLNTVSNGHQLDILNVNLNNINGYIHTHLNNFEDGVDKNGDVILKKPIRIFSPADIIAFLSIAKRSNDISNVYATVITGSGNYTLRFTGNKDDIIGDIKTAKEYEADYRNIMKKYKSDKEQGFLKFLIDHIKVKGIELYKLHNPLFSSDIIIQKKTLNINGKVETEDCNE